MRAIDACRSMTGVGEWEGCEKGDTRAGARGAHRVDAHVALAQPCRSVEKSRGPFPSSDTVDGGTDARMHGDPRVGLS